MFLVRLNHINEQTANSNGTIKVTMLKIYNYMILTLVAYTYLLLPIAVVKSGQELDLYAYALVLS